MSVAEPPPPHKPFQRVVPHDYGGGEREADQDANYDEQSNDVQATETENEGGGTSLSSSSPHDASALHDGAHLPRSAKNSLRGKNKTLKPAVPETPEEAEARKRAARRVKVIREIVSSEESYVRSLALLEKVYILPLQMGGAPAGAAGATAAERDEESKAETISAVAQCLQAHEVDTLFSNIQTILKINQHFLEDIQARTEHVETQAVTIGDIVIKFVPFFRLYSAYVKNHEQANNFLRTVENNPKKYEGFKNFLKQCEVLPESNGQTLSSLLIMPIQRIPRYRLLLDELLKCTDATDPDHELLVQALEQVKQVATHINEAVRIQEQNAVLVAIQEKFSNSIELLAPGRVFLRQETLTKMGRKSNEKYEFFLFNDLLIYSSKYLAPNGWKYKLGKKFPIDSKFKVKDVPDERVKKDTEKGCHFQILAHEESFVVIAPDPATKTTWLTELEKCVQERESRMRHSMQGAVLAPVLEQFGSDNQCCVCGESPSLFNRRHCKHCGRVVHENCSKTKMVLPGTHDKVMKRVCDTCRDKIRAERMSELTGGATAAGTERDPSLSQPEISVSGAGGGGGDEEQKSRETSTTVTAPPKKKKAPPLPPGSRPRAVTSPSLPAQDPAPVPVTSATAVVSILPPLPEPAAAPPAAPPMEAAAAVSPPAAPPLEPVVEPKPAVVSPVAAPEPVPVAPPPPRVPTPPPVSVPVAPPVEAPQPSSPAQPAPSPPPVVPPLIFSPEPTTAPKTPSRLPPAVPPRSARKRSEMPLSISTNPIDVAATQPAPETPPTAHTPGPVPTAPPPPEVATAVPPAPEAPALTDTPPSRARSASISVAAAAVHAAPAVQSPAPPPPSPRKKPPPPPPGSFNNSNNRSMVLSPAAAEQVMASAHSSSKSMVFFPPPPKLPPVITPPPPPSSQPVITVQPPPTTNKLKLPTPAGAAAADDDNMHAREPSITVVLPDLQDDPSAPVTETMEDDPDMIVTRTRREAVEDADTSSRAPLAIRTLAKQRRPSRPFFDHPNAFSSEMNGRFTFNSDIPFPPVYRKFPKHYPGGNRNSCMPPIAWQLDAQPAAADDWGDATATATYYADPNVDPNAGYYTDPNAGYTDPNADPNAGYTDGYATTDPAAASYHSDPNTQEQQQPEWTGDQEQQQFYTDESQYYYTDPEHSAPAEDSSLPPLPAGPVPPPMPPPGPPPAGPPPIPTAEVASPRAPSIAPMSPRGPPPPPRRNKQSVNM